MREVLFCTVYFGTYEQMRDYFSNFLTLGPGGIMLAGGFSGMFSWFISYPLDSVKTIVQGRQAGDPKKSSWAIANHLISSRGFRGLYSGVGPSIARAFIVSGSRFSAFELVCKLLAPYEKNQF